MPSRGGEAKRKGKQLKYICLEETAVDEIFPRELFRDLGFVALIGAAGVNVGNSHPFIVVRFSVFMAGVFPWK